MEVSFRINAIFGCSLFDAKELLILTLQIVDLGENASTLISYLERNGAPPCPKEGNPAEWMLSVTHSQTDGLDWHQIWRDSPEYQHVKEELRRLRARKDEESSPPTEHGSNEDPYQHEEFVTSFSQQFREVFLRTAKHFWRSPRYMYSKFGLIVIAVSIFVF